MQNQIFDGLSKIIVANSNSTPSLAQEINELLSSNDIAIKNFLSKLETEYSLPKNRRKRSLSALKQEIQQSDSPSTKRLANEILESRITDNVSSPQWLLDYVGD